MVEVAKGGKQQEQEASAESGRFQGYCGHCHKWGHKKADCPDWKKKEETERRKEEDGDAGAVSVASSDSAQEVDIF